MHYFECHITVEPVFGAQLEQLRTVAARYGFKVADLLMQKRVEDAPVRSKHDTFCTARGADFIDISHQMHNCMVALAANGFTVWRYKIESTILDVRVNHHAG